METKKNNSIMAECPSFDSCSSPKCPLDIFQDQRIRFSDEDKCKANKKSRIKIGIKNKLKNYGLTSREAQGIILSYGSLEAYIKPFLSDFNSSLNSIQKLKQKEVSN